MSSGYIKYGSGSAVSAGGGAAAVWSVVDRVLSSWYDVQRIKAEMDSLVGSPADYTQLETPFGLVSGTGQAFYNTVVGLKANLDTTCPSLATVDRTA